MLFAGLNTQALNTPIDLFIENFIFSEYSEIRPYQFLSLYSNLQDGLKSATDKKVLELSPPDIVSKSKIYSLVNALQFKELYGMDFIKDFQSTSSELKLAQTFYDEYLQYKDDREPGEEYDLVQHWAEDLHIDKYFELIPEKEYRTKRTDLNGLLESIENDPFGAETIDPHKEREMEKFQQSQKELGTNMAVAMFMVGALQYFDGMPKEKIREIAFEIALQGTQGYSPDRKDYKLNKIPGKVFSGYHILAYYYVSWMLSAPEVVPELQLPYEGEYKLARTLFKPKNNG